MTIGNPYLTGSLMLLPILLTAAMILLWGKRKMPKENKEIKQNGTKEELPNNKNDN